MSSFRRRLRAFQAIRGPEPDPAFIADLEFLENRDLDLSVRQGALLSFNALLITVGTHPVSASPGAPLSLDAPTQPGLTAASLLALAPLVASSYLCLRALLAGEEFDAEGGEDDAVLRQRLQAAFVRSLDLQTLRIGRAVRCTLAGGVLTLIVWAAILWAKMA